MFKSVKFAFAGVGSALSAIFLEWTQWVKYRTLNGHGFSAEDAANQADRLKFRNVDAAGFSNAKHGPDRIVDGINVQTKYYASARSTVNAAFDTKSGAYLYQGQILEVPKEQYAEAVKLMKDKIRAGKIPGFSDPGDAERLVRQGEVTYEQAKNIARAGNVDSIIFDLKNQTVACSCTFGLSFVVQYSLNIRSGKSKKDAMRKAFEAGLSSSLNTAISGVLTAQLLRTAAGRGLAASLMQSPKKVLRIAYKTEAGKKLIESAARVTLGKSVHGGAALNHVTKVFRSNVVTGIVTTAVISAPDFYRALFSRSMSWTQFMKNLAVNAATVIGGAGGFFAGAAIGGLAGGPLGLVVGLIIGGLGGVLAGKGAKKAVDKVADDDAVSLRKAVEQAAIALCTDYLLDEAEVEKVIVPNISKLITAKWLRRMYKAGGKGINREVLRLGFATAELRSVFEAALKKRERIKIPADGKVRKEMERYVESINVEQEVETA